MFFCSPFNENFLYKQFDSEPNVKALKSANQYLDDGFLDMGHEILDKLIEKGDLTALLLSSIFSKKNESEENFNQRHINTLCKLAELGNEFALYSLGVYFDQGNFLELDKEKALGCYKLAAEKGMPQAEHIYGIMLYYGTGGATQDKACGLNMVINSAKSGVEEAREFLEYIKIEN